MEPMDKIKTAKEQALRAWGEDKINLAHRWIDDEKKQSGRNFVRGAIHKAELGENIGTEQGEYRPIIIISNDLINSTSGNVLVLPLTKSLKFKIIDGKKVPKFRSNYFLFNEKYSFLEHDSAVLIQDARSISKVRIGGFKGILEVDDLKKIISRVKWVFGI